MNALKLIFDRMRLNVILLVLDFVTIFSLVGLLNLSNFEIFEYNQDFNTISFIIAFELGFIIAFILLHYIFKLTKKDIIIRTIIYLIIVNIVIFFSVFLFAGLISIPSEYRMIDIFLISIISYEFSALVYKLLAKTSLIEKISNFRKTEKQEVEEKFVLN